MRFVSKEIFVRVCWAVYILRRDDEQKAFAKEVGIEECELEARYHYPVLLGPSMSAPPYGICCIWNFPSCWKKEYNSISADAVDGTFCQRAITMSNTVTAFFLARAVPVSS